MPTMKALPRPRSIGAALAIGQIARIALAGASMIPATGVAFAQSNPAYIRLLPAAGALYRPDSGSPHVGLIVMHRTANYLVHPACTELSRRGFLVLCMNSRFANNESQVRWELIAF